MEKTGMKEGMMTINDLSKLPDTELIREIKENNSSDCLVELVSRHTGIYMTVISSFTGSPVIHVEDFADDKFVNFYNYAIDYDESRGTKFSSYLYNRTRYSCLNRISDNDIILSSDNLDYMESPEERINVKVERCDIIADIFAEVDKFEDSLFKQVFRLRHNMDSTYQLTWPEIGQRLKISGEWARCIYNNGIKTLRTKVLSHV